MHAHTHARTQRYLSLALSLSHTHTNTHSRSHHAYARKTQPRGRERDTHAWQKTRTNSQTHVYIIEKTHEKHTRGRTDRLTYTQCTNAHCTHLTTHIYTDTHTTHTRHTHTWTHTCTRTHVHTCAHVPILNRGTHVHWCVHWICSNFQQCKSVATKRRQIPAALVRTEGKATHAAAKQQPGYDPCHFFCRPRLIRSCPL